MQSVLTVFSPKQVEDRISRELLGMSDQDAVAYLIDQLKKERYQRIDRMCLLLTDYPGMRPVVANLFLTLYDARGRIVTYTLLEERFVSWADYTTNPSNLQSHMKHLRKHVVSSSIPVRITTHYSFGYALHVTDHDWKPVWAKPNAELYL